MRNPEEGQQNSMQSRPSKAKGIIFQLADGSVQGCNAQAEAILGFTEEQVQNRGLMGLPWMSMDADGNSSPSQTHPAWVALQTAQSCLGVVMGIHHPNGKTIWMQIDAEPLFRANATVPYAVISSLIEISESTQNQKTFSSGNKVFSQPSQSTQPLVNLLPTAITPQTVNQQAANILESMTDAFIALDRDWRITYVNQATARINQVSPEELIGKSHWDVWSASVGTVCEENYRRAIAEQTPVHFEFFYEPRQRWYEIHAYPFEAGLGIYYRDINDRKQAHNALQASEEQLRLALDFAQIGTWDWNLLTNQVEWSDIHFLLLGLNPDTAETSYSNWRERVHPEDVNLIEGLIFDSLKTHTTYQAEYRVIHPNGSIRWLMGKGRAIYDASGQPIRMVGALMDVTEQKQIDADLRQYKDIFQFTENGLAISRGELIEIANPAFAKMHGYSVEEITGKAILELFPAEYQAEAIAFMQRLDQAGHLTHESAHVRKDGSICPTLLDVTVVKDEQGKILYRIVTAFDLTNRKTLEDERRQAEAEVHLLNQQLQQLIQVIQQLAAARNLATIMAAVRTAARRLVRADGSTFVLREGDTSYYADEDAIAPLWRGRRFPMDSCVAGWTMLNQQPAIIPDIFSDPRIPIDVYRATFVRSLVMMPIQSIDPIGAIGVYWANCHSPTKDEVNLLDTLANAAAIAIQNVHLYEELEQRVQERTTQLQQSLDFEALLKRITDKVRDSLDEQQILQTAVTELAQGLNLTCCNTSIYDAERKTRTIVSEFTRASFSSRSRAFEISTDDHTEVYRILSRGEICQFCNLFPQAITSESLSAILACPIQDDQEVLGDLWLFKERNETFNEQEVRLVQQVANQCAIALRQSRLYQTAQLQVTELQQLNQLKDDFLSTVSHELRAPMTNIKMAVQVLELTLGIAGKNAAKQATGDIVLPQSRFAKVIQYFEILNQSCQREISLINDLLDLARLDAGTIELTLTEVLLQDWLPRLIEPFTDRMQQHQQHLKMQIPSGLSPYTTDLPSLERILTELFQNACKYTPSGEAIVVEIRENASRLQIVISNSGVEIPQAECDRIFDKFYRIPQNDPWKHGGTGLGLALIKRLAEVLQGTIQVTSTDGWTTFTLSLPR